MKTNNDFCVLALSVAASLGLAACGSDAPPDVPPDQPPTTTSGDPENTFDHDNNVDTNPFELLDRIQVEGPPKYSSRVHGCTKIRYATFGNVLASRGVDIAGGGALSAGDLYRTGYNAMGGANYQARVRENIELNTSAASRMFDTFVQAAPEIIANIGTRPECQIGGIGVELFNASNQCSADGITCLIGVPATAAHLELCNLTISRASDIDLGKRLAVASLLAAAHTCE